MLFEINAIHPDEHEILMVVCDSLVETARHYYLFS